MKKRMLLWVGLLGSALATAQIRTPQPSPGSELKQAVGLTEVVVNYSRPSARGRVIFGDLVPYDKVWRTGANMNTTISFSDPVMVGETELPAGTYALYTKPGKDQWTAYFSTDTNNGGLPAQWDDAKVAASLTVPAMAISETVETFTIMLGDLTNNGATIDLLWANTYVGIPFGVPTKEKAMRSIEATMGGPGGGDYYAAASYYHDEGLDLEKARGWIDKATELSPDAYWIWRRKSLIYAALGDKKGAIAAAKESLAKARQAGNMDYVKLNEDSLKEWGGM